jgi:hypothetical protein
VNKAALIWANANTVPATIASNSAAAAIISFQWRRAALPNK